MNNNNYEDLTEKQEKILISIKKYIKKNKISPTVRELCLINDIKSTATIHDFMEILKNKGYITYIEHSGRSIVVLK